MTGYVKFLRDHVGHAPVQLCSAGVLVENEKGKSCSSYGQTTIPGAYRAAP